MEKKTKQDKLAKKETAQTPPARSPEVDAVMEQLRGNPSINGMPIPKYENTDEALARTALGAIGTFLPIGRVAQGAKEVIKFGAKAAKGPIVKGAQYLNHLSDQLTPAQLMAALSLGTKGYVANKVVNAFGDSNQELQAENATEINIPPAQAAARPPAEVRPEVRQQGFMKPYDGVDGLLAALSSNPRQDAPQPQPVQAAEQPVQAAEPVQAAQPVQPAQQPAQAPQQMPVQAQAAPQGMMQAMSQADPYAEVLDYYQGLKRPDAVRPQDNTAELEAAMLEIARMQDERMVGSQYERPKMGFIEKGINKIKPLTDFIGGRYDKNAEHKAVIDMLERELALKQLQSGAMPSERAAEILNKQRFDSELSQNSRFNEIDYNDSKQLSPSQIGQGNVLTAKATNAATGQRMQNKAQLESALSLENSKQLSGLSLENSKQLSALSMENARKLMNEQDKLSRQPLEQGQLMEALMQKFPAMFSQEALQDATGGMISQEALNNIMASYAPRAAGDSDLKLILDYFDRQRNGGLSTAGIE
jgi:hypothetical protein